MQKELRKRGSFFMQIIKNEGIMRLFFLFFPIIYRSPPQQFSE